MGIRKTLAYQALTYGAALGASALANRGANQGFKAARGKKPPLNPASRNTSWKAALTYGAVTGAIGAMAGIAGRRVIAGVWRKKIGRLPMGER